MPLMAATMLCGATVSGRSGDALGTITDAMIESDSGCIACVVLAHGGVPGVGEKLFAVPWDRLRAAPEDGSISVDADADALAAAEGIDKDAWPPSAPADWLA